MRPSGIFSRSTSPQQAEVDLDSGRNKGLHNFPFGVRGRFEGKAGPGRRGCCHKSLAGLGMPRFAFALEFAIVDSIQHVPERNKPCTTIQPEIDPISHDRSSYHLLDSCLLLSGIPICRRIASITLFRMILPPTRTPTAFPRIPVDILFRLDLEGRVFPAGYGIGLSHSSFSIIRTRKRPALS